MFAKKNLIAAASLLALAAAAQAQSSVTLYGNLDAAVDYVKVKQSSTNTSASKTGVDSSILTESYFGLRGTEDLGSGLKTIFKLESTIAVDTGKAAGATFFDKNAYVGLAGDFGTVRLGNIESAFKLEGNAFNPFGASALLAPTNALFVGALGLGGSWQNSVAYTSPNLSGLTLSAQHSAKEAGNATATKYNGGATSVSANYVAGPLGLSAVYGDFRSNNAAAATDRQRAFLLGASYDFGVVKAFAQYGQDKITEKAVGGSNTPKFFQLGAVVPVTQAGSIHAAYGQTKLDGDKAQQFSLAYHHTLTKRTGVYAGVTYIKDQLLDNNAGRGDAAIKTTAIAAGLHHAF